MQITERPCSPAMGAHCEVFMVPVKMPALYEKEDTTLGGTTHVESQPEAGAWPGVDMPPPPPPGALPEG